MKTSLKRKEIVDLLKKGKRKIVDGITIVYDQEKDKESRFAILVPKKKIRKSTERNKVRRLFREAVAECGLPYHHFLIICTKNNYTYKEIQETLEQLKKV